MQDKRKIRQEIITYLCGGSELSPKFIRLLEKGGLTENDGRTIQDKMAEELDSNCNLDLLFEEGYIGQLKDRDDYPAEEMRRYLSDEEYLQLLKKHFPQTVSEAVDSVIGMLDEEEIKRIGKQDKSAFTWYHHFGLGLFMRNNFGINQGHAGSLLADISEKSGDSFLFNDDISGYLLEEVWDEIQRRFGDKMKLEKLLDECDDAYFSEDYEQLIEKCDEILEESPDCQKAISYKGIALCFLDRYDEALEVLKNGIEIYPDNYYMKNNIAMVYYDLGYYEQSLKCCEEGLKIKDFDWLCENRIKALIKLGRMDEAVEFYKTLNHESVDLEDILLEKDLCFEALDYYYGLLKDNPDDVHVIDRIKMTIVCHNLNLTPEVGDYYIKWIDSIKKVNDTKVCPYCGGELIPIIWGYPSEDLLEKANRGEVHLGGCVIEDNTNFHCNGCEEDFSIPGICSQDIKFKEYIKINMFMFNLVFRFGSKGVKSLEELRKDLFHFTDEEFDVFIARLKEIGYIREPKEGYLELTNKNIR